MAVSTTSDYVVAFTPWTVWAGKFPGGSMTMVGSAGDGLQGPLIESAVMTDPRDAIAKVWAVDGNRSVCVDVINNTVTPWPSEVTAANTGTLPLNCALCCRYNGRMVLAQQADNRAIYYMSRRFNPLDWRYGAIPAQTSAVVGTDPVIGAPADAIVALIPSGDDYLIFGCQGSIYQMVGDPGDNGVCVPLSHKTGILDHRAWCFDESGRLLFLGNDGLNVYSGPGSAIENITGNRLTGLLDRVNTNDTLIQLSFDAFKKEAHILLTPKVGADPGVHVVVNRLGGVFLDQYPVDFGPWSALSTDGRDDQDRRILMGGDDGYIRQLDDSKPDDDDHVITAYFDSAPVEAPKGLREMTMTEIMATGYENTDAVSWLLYTGRSADEVRRASAAVASSGTFFAVDGFNQPIGLRQTAGAFRVRVSQSSKTDTFAVEEMVARAVVANRRR